MAETVGPSQPSRPSGPPRLARWLLRRRLPRSIRDPFVGDLDERFRSAAASDASRAKRDYWKDALSPSLVQYRREAKGMDLPRGAAPGSAGGDGMLTTLWADLRFAIRTLSKSPSFTAVAVLSLALGIGPNTAIFSLVHTAMFQDWGVDDPDRLLDIYNISSSGSYNFSGYGTFELVEEGAADVFDGVTQYSMYAGRIEMGPGNQEMVLGEMVSGNYFDVMGVSAARGRTFLPEEDETLGTHPVIVLSHYLWETRFGSDPDLVGGELRLEGRPYTVIGVAPETFRGRMTPGLGTDFWVPYNMYPHLNPDKPGQGDLWVSGRVSDGVAPAAAMAAVRSVATRFNEEANAADPERRTVFRLEPVVLSDVKMSPMFDDIVSQMAALLLVAVGLVLLVACVNLAGFLLSRAVDRRKEMAIRVAMGAGRSDIVRQLLIEALVIASLGGVAGLAMGYGAVQALAGIDLPLPFPIQFEVELSTPLLLFTIGTTLVAAVVFGLTPALEALRAPTAATLRDEAGSSGGRKKVGVRALLVGLQMALSTVLLFGAGLFVRSLQAATDVDVGFSRAPAAVVTVELDPNEYDGEERVRFIETMESRIGSSAGVTSVGTTSRMPLDLGNYIRSFDVPGVDPPPNQNQHRFEIARVTPSYFAALAISVNQGQVFGAQDAQESRSVAIVSQAAARQLWPGESAVGKVIYPAGDPDFPITVVGVADDVKIWSLSEPPRPYVYMPWSQAATSTTAHFVARGNQGPTQLAALIRDEALTLDPDLLVARVGTLDDHLRYIYFLPRMAALLLSSVGALALILACLGLYGMVSYSVSRRTREMGIRLALGADRGKVIGLVLKSAMVLVAIGGGIGVLAALGLGGLVRQFLLGVSGLDPITLLLAPAVLTGVAGLAAWIPARRASRVDPMEALRSE